MLLLKISSIYMLFDKKILMYKFHITNKTLSTTKWVQIIDLKEFVIVVLDADRKTFIVYVAIQNKKK